MSRDPRPGRKPQPASNDVVWAGAGIILAVALLGVLLWFLGAVLDPGVDTAGTNPASLLLAQGRGYLPVGRIQLLVFALGIGLLVAIAALLLIMWRRARTTRTRIDHLARDMSHARDFAPLGARAAAAHAQRLGAGQAGPGVPLGRLLTTGEPLFGSWEGAQTWVMGPRAGKTTCVCVPQVMETTGPVLATSNKRDLIDMTRGPRARLGAVWVQDVQNIIGEHPSWWWNPLSFVTGMDSAEQLADIFVSSATETGAKQDAYFESDGKRLLAHLLYAAAVGRRPVTDVFIWSQTADDKTPRNILLSAGHQGLAEGLGQIQSLTPKQRDGVYGTMRPWVNVLSHEAVIPWIRDTGVMSRPAFDHRAFASSTDTLYLVSREGGGSARAITAALAMAVMTAAEKTAAHQPGGRLATPLLAVLDEVANVVRWRELPEVYSHYGSRGIILCTFFQSYTQGVEAYGEKGMAKLWGAANLRVAGPGLSDDKFLPFLSQLIGEHDVHRRTSGTQRGGRSVSTHLQRERLLDIADLAALPRGRAVLTGSGLPAGLIKLEHYSRKSYAGDVERSQDYYEGVKAPPDIE